MPLSAIWITIFRRRIKNAYGPRPMKFRIFFSVIWKRLVIWLKGVDSNSVHASKPKEKEGKNTLGIGIGLRNVWNIMIIVKTVTKYKYYKFKRYGFRNSDCNLQADPFFRTVWTSQHFCKFNDAVTYEELFSSQCFLSYL